MCKLYIITGSVRKENALRIIDKCNDSFKFSQRDGFGFIAAGREETAWGRYQTPDQFPGFHSGIIDKISGPKLEEGEFPSKVQTLMIHGRTSTNVRGVEHCHPFRNKDWYLIHNGVLDWVGRNEDDPNCKVDSESFLEWFVRGGELNEANKFWAGYGALFLYDDELGERVLIKDETTSLYIAKRQNDGYVFATSEYDLRDVCEKGGILLQSKAVKLPKCMITFDDKGNFESFDEWCGFASRTYDSRCQTAMGYQQGLNQQKQYMSEKEAEEVWTSL
jgi:predicted glutamine amidotransferase